MSAFFRFRAVLAAALTAVVTAVVPAASADAARIRGTLKDLEVKVTSKPLGFTRIRIAAPSEAAARRSRSAALFLAVKDGESLPIPAPKEHQIITIEGLRFSPNIASWDSDAQVSFINADREPVTVSIDGEVLGTIDPGTQKTYVCSPGKPNRAVRVEEWSHMRALIYVGEVGVAGTPNPRGRFSIDAPRGTYELRVLTQDGVAFSTEVEVKNSDKDLGRLELGKTEAAGQWATEWPFG